MSQHFNPFDPLGLIERDPLGLFQRPSPPASRSKKEAYKPGCVVADETLLVLAHLWRLGEGWGGFGVLRLSKERLERAARAATYLGQAELSEALSGIADELPNVLDAEAATEVADALEEYAKQAWNLGLACGRTAGAMAKARAALSMIQSGEVAFDA